MQRMMRNRWRLTGVLVALLALTLSGAVLAAEMDSEEIYRLEAGEVLEDDLYVTGSEIYIDGTVQGDLIAAGEYIEVNGTVTEDAMLAGAGIVINGTVQDDARLAGSGIEVNGSIGDDLFAAGGGGNTFPMFGTDQPVPPGVSLDSESQVGGDAVIAGGEGSLAGTVSGNLYAFMGTLDIAAQVGGNAEIGGDTIRIDDSTQIAGELRYSSDERIDVPAGAASSVSFEEMTEEEERTGRVSGFVGWLWRTVLLLVGFALLGWLVLRFVPGVIKQPAAALASRPGMAALAGFVVTILFIFIPLASILLVFLMVLFWGWFPGIMMGLFLFGTLALFWFLSPLITGLWVGRWFNSMMGRELDNLPVLLVGILALVLLGRIPFVGWLVYLLSFIFAIGALVLARRGAARQEAPQPITP